MQLVLVFYQPNEPFLNVNFNLKTSSPKEWKENLEVEKIKLYMLFVAD